jgi:hypothetical protein
MLNATKPLGYLNVAGVFRLLQAGISVYIASAPADTNALPLEGGWVDTDGEVHLDLSEAYLNKDTALSVARTYKQECILALEPNPNAQGKVFLLKDLPLNREICLRYAGGYTADGSHIITAVQDGKSVPFIEELVKSVPVEVSFLPVK